MKPDKKDISLDIQVSPSSINPHFHSFLHKKLTNELVGVYRKDIGYILSINKINNIEGGTASTSGSNILFTLTLNIDVIDPQINDVMNLKISSVVSSGFFVEDRCLRVFIPQKKFSDETSIRGNAVYIKEKKYEIGDYLDILIYARKQKGYKLQILGSIAS